ncbi:hypothetical protein D3C85_1771030 [compost metagenome]
MGCGPLMERGDEPEYLAVALDGTDIARGHSMSILAKWNYARFHSAIYSLNNGLR